MNRAPGDFDPLRCGEEHVVVTTTFDRTENVQWTETRLEQRMSGPCEDLGRWSEHVDVSAITRIEFVHEHVDELRDVLWGAAMDNVEVVRRDRRTLRYRREQADDDEFNVARR